MLESECDFENACAKSEVSPPPKNRVPKTTFSTTSQLNALTVRIFGMKHDLHKRARWLQTTRGLLHRLKTTRTLVLKRLKTGPTFYPLCVNSAL